jgi:hypothetical protein
VVISPAVHANGSYILGTENAFILCKCLLYDMNFKLLNVLCPLEIILLGKIKESISALVPK